MMDIDKIIRESRIYIKEIKNGDYNSINNLWATLLPITKKLAFRLLFNRGSTDLFDAEDIVNESYFAIRQAIEHCKFVTWDDKEICSFIRYYKFCIRGQTMKLRGIYCKHDPIRNAKSFDAKLKDDSDDFTLANVTEDIISSKQFEDVLLSVYQKELHSALNTLIKLYLPEQEKLVIYAKYYDNRTDLEIAKALGITAGDVRAIESRAIFKLRCHQEEVKLSAFL